MTKVTCWLCHRLREPSTWAALSVPFATWGTQMPTPYSYYIFSVSSLCGIAAIILGEKK